MVTDVYCTFCTLMKFIENKELHTVNLMTVPHELKAVLEDKRSHSYVCNETQKYLDREFCPKYHFMVNKLKSYEIVTTTVKPSKFWMPKEVKNLECQKLIEGDKTYIKKAINNRIKYNDTNLSMKCSDILKRGFNKDLEPKSEIEKKYSIAYASNVYKNDDIPLKSNKELLETLEAMNFPNDIAFVDPSLTVPERYNYSDAWTYEDLNIFLESDPRKNDSNIQLQKVVFQKGLVPAGLRRDTVEYMLTKLNITTFLDKLNNHNLYGHDELSLQTLLSDDVLRIPGHIPRKCLNRYRPRDTFLSRYVIWEPRPCITNIYHHQICTWGVEMLHEMLSYPQWFGYRFREDADWGAAVCWMEYMYNKNYFTTYESPDLWLYYNLPQSTLEREQCPKYHFMLNKLNSYKGNVTTTKKARPFWKPEDVKNLKCQRLFNGDKKYISSIVKNRIVYNDSSLSMECEDIYKRGFNVEIKPSSEIENKYSIAYASNVYKNYGVIERKLSIHYSRNNHYCYMIDSKSPAIFDVMKKLEKCLPNVYVSNIQFDMKSNGENATFGHLECMKLLLKKKAKFHYLILHQNDDFPLKSNREILEILEAMSFPIEMAFVDPSSTVPERYNYSYGWRYKDLGIFLKDDPRLKDKNLMLKNVVFQKGMVAAGFTRAAVEYIVNSINVTKFFKQLNSDLYGNDELSWQTLLSDDNIRVPGYIPRKCLPRYRPRDTYLLRKVIWKPRPCLTHTLYHQVCTFGVETLVELTNYHDLFGYRFKEEIDWGAAVCWFEHIYNKNNNFEKYHIPDLWYYYNLPQAILERYRNRNDFKSMNDCDF
uniref:CAP10 domain-containing protein n=1 Tax=Parastrongyloides trichosuri TaxID=131310 RepID=A0A0N4ZGL8_PARTI